MWQLILNVMYCLSDNGHVRSIRGNNATEKYWQDYHLISNTGLPTKPLKKSGQSAHLIVPSKPLEIKNQKQPQKNHQSLVPR